MLDGHRVAVHVEALCGVVPEVVLDEVVGGLPVVREVGLPEVVVRAGHDQLGVARVRLGPCGVDGVDDRAVLNRDELASGFAVTGRAWR